MTIQSRWRARRATRGRTDGDDQGGVAHRPPRRDTAAIEPSPSAVALQRPDQIRDNSVGCCTPDADLVTRYESVAPTVGADAGTPTASTPVRTPKAAVVIAQTLRNLIVDGQVMEGDFLPNETQLMGQYGVSRSTLREAVRLLEAERLVEVRRGARTGARVRIPGPETVARPAGLLLQVSGATFADIMAARCGIEPLAVNLLAQKRTPRDLYELESLLAEDIPAARESGRLPDATAKFHLRLVELSGNATLSMIARMLHEITQRHSASPTRRHNLAQPDYEKLLQNYRELIDLLRAGNGGAAEAHWRRHMNTGIELMSHSLATRKVRDVVD